MEKVLTQEEIDALFRASWGQIGAGAGVSDNPVRMERWNLHEAGQLRKDQLRSLTLILCR